MDLGASHVYRGGITSPYITHETSNVKIGSNEGKVWLSFTMASKGGGTTYVRLDIGCEDFGNFLSRMSEADRQQAMNAMLEEVKDQVALQPQCIDKAERRGREQVSELARQKYLDAPVGNDDQERLISDAAANLVQELKESEQEAAA